MKKAVISVLLLLWAPRAWAEGTTEAVPDVAGPSSDDALWVLVAGILVFFMQAGFKCLEVGMVRPQHAATVAMKNIVDWTVGLLVFFLVGFGLMFGTSVQGMFGGSLFAPETFDVAGSNSLGAIFFLFQIAFAGTALTIVSGAMSERTGFVPYLTASCVIAMLIYPVFGH